MLAALTSHNSLLWRWSYNAGVKVAKRHSSSSSASDQVSALPPREVVGKVYHRGGRVTSEEQFLRQSDVLKDIQGHDSIVQMLDVLKDDIPCLVLELAPLGDLQNYLDTAEGRQTPTAKLVKWAAKVCYRLMYETLVCSLQLSNYVSADCLLSLSYLNYAKVSFIIPKF